MGKPARVARIGADRKATSGLRDLRHAVALRVGGGSVPQKKPAFPEPGRQVVYFQGPSRVAVPHRSNLLDEERGSGRLRPVAGPVDRDERNRVIASLGNVYDGSITGSGVV